MGAGVRVLSNGGRDYGDKRLGLEVGFGRSGPMEEDEVEEGEAWSRSENDALVDPDVALSYIDAKIQDVLGHFQKDFEGGVSAENLGAKFGGYGSFLPAYQRSPSIRSQPRSPFKAPSQNVPRPPDNQSFEYGHKNHTVQTSASISKDCTGSTLQPQESSCKKDKCINMLSAEVSNLNRSSIDKPADGGDQKILKVCIKVGTDNISARNNAATLYSGLGLDFSPFSSPEDSHGHSGGVYLGLQDLPHESPTTILQMMTCFPVQGGYLLSPLPDSVLRLAENGSPYLKKCSTGTHCNGIQNTYAFLADLTLPMEDAKLHVEKKMKPVEENRRVAYENNINCKDAMSTIFMRETNIETPEAREIVSSALNIALLTNCPKVDDIKAGGQELVSNSLVDNPSLSGSKCVDREIFKQITGESAKHTSRMLDICRNSNKISMKDDLSLLVPVKKNLFDLKGDLENNRAGRSLNKTTHTKVKLCSKISSSQKTQERKSSNHNDASCDFRREDSVRHQKNYFTAKADSDKGKMDYFVGPAEYVKQKSDRKATSCEQDGKKLLKGKGLLSEGKIRSKGSETNGTACMEFSKDNMRFRLSTSSKENKSLQTSGDCSKTLKSYKVSFKGLGEEFGRDVMGNLKAEKVDDGTSLLEKHSKDKLKDPNIGNEKTMEKPSGISEALVKALVDTPLTSDPTSDTVAPANDPVLMKDIWVRCDNCDTWRLLPYGTDESKLPHIWKCSMQIWLPGLNKCSISKDESVKAFLALYEVPVPENGTNLNGHHDIAPSNLSVAQHLDQNLESTTQNMTPNRKKKHKLKDTSNVLNHLTVTKFSDTVKKNQQASIKNKSSNDTKTFPLELDPLSRVGFEQMSSSADFTMHKQHKQKEELRRQSDGGDSIAHSGRHSKMKCKRKVDEGGSKISKKMKTHVSHHCDDDWHSDYALAGKAVSRTGNILSTNGNYLQESKDNTYSNDSKHGSKDNFPLVNEKSKGQVRVISDEELKEHFSVSKLERSDKVDFAVKKRKVEERQENQTIQGILMRSQHHGDNRVNAKEELTEVDLRKEKKSRVSKSEEQESTSCKVDSTMDKKGHIPRIMLSGGREQLADGIDESRGFAGRECQAEQYQWNAASEQALDGNDCFKRDLSITLSSGAANSSSSKVSGSQKSKANFQETSGSPVESVSSSPLRISTTKEHAKRRNSIGKDDAMDFLKSEEINSGFPDIVSLKRCSNGKVDSGSEQFGSRKKEQASFVQERSLESLKGADYGVQDSLRGTYYPDEVSNPFSGGKVKGRRRHLKTSVSTQYDLFPVKLEETKLVNGSVNTLDQQKNLVKNQDKLNETPGKGRIHGQDLVNNHDQLNRLSQWKSGKSSSCSMGRYRSLESDFEKTKLNVSKSFNKQEALHPAKNGSIYRHEAEPESHDHSTYEENLMDEYCNFQEQKGWKVNTGKKVAVVGRMVNNLTNGVQENLYAHVPFRIPQQHKVLSSRSVLSGATYDKSNFQGNIQQEHSHIDDRSSVQIVLDRNDRSEANSEKGKSESLLPSFDNQEMPGQGPYPLHTPQKEIRSEKFSFGAANGAASNLVKQAKKLDNQNVARHSSLRQHGPDELDARSPSRNYNQSAANCHVVKEARNLKHTANRLKDEGLELESTGLYFQAALKFLHVAFLWEPPSVDITKYDKASQSMRMYIETAKLCEFCAHAYERYKQMAAAALAYKCMEVAYFKVAYFRHPIANKDRQELQAALQMVLPGGSPSSSASDVDNLNNLGTLEKAASAEGVSSPGNYVIAARCRPTYARLLNYTNATILAFEASRKAQNAFAAATAGLEKETNGLSSIKEVLNFNFHNVEGLLRIIRLGMESINS